MFAVSVPTTRYDWHTLSRTGLPSALEKVKSCFTVPWIRENIRRSKTWQPHDYKTSLSIRRQVKFVGTYLRGVNLNFVRFDSVNVLIVYNNNLRVTSKGSCNGRRRWWWWMEGKVMNLNESCWNFLKAQLQVSMDSIGIYLLSYINNN